MADWVVPIIVALIAAGLFGWLRDLWKNYKEKKAAALPEAVEAAAIHAAVAQADESVLVVARARAELALDNKRLREEIAEKDLRHATERLEWRKERQELREEIDALEQKLRMALGEVQALKQRHGMTEPN